MPLPGRNPVIHDRNPSTFEGNYQITDQALKNYGVTRNKFGSTDIALPNGGTFNVKDYQYILEDGKVGMFFIPVDEYGTVTGPDGKEAWASQLADQYIRKRMGLKANDPLYAYIYFFHPEQNKISISDPKTFKDKVEMGITHLGAYYGQGITSNSPPLYHHRTWGVFGEVNTNYGYPANVMMITMDGVDQAMLNKNFILADTFLNYGIRFPKDYKNSKFREIDINTCLMFYRDWIKEENYLKTDKTWFTYCAAHKTLVATVALNLPHNKNAFMEVYGASEGEDFYNVFCKNYYELTGYNFTPDDETDFEPLWKKQGFTQSKIKPFSLAEYEAYDKARREGTLPSFKGFKPLSPTEGTGWSPQFSADVIFDFIDIYADFIDAGAIISCGTIIGFMTPITERMGISDLEYLLVSMPILEILMQGHAMIYAPIDPDPDYSKSKYYNETFEALYVAFGGKADQLPAALKNLPEVEKYKGRLKDFVKFLLAQNNLAPEFLAWWSLTRVRDSWSQIIASPSSLPESAYDWVIKTVSSEFEDARKVIAPEEDSIQFNAPPAIAHMIGVGMFAKNPHVTLKTLCTVMEHNELELKTKPN